ncbi:MAG: cyclic nucleotide-binding domain-containing protein [Jatrophihabitans sp.]|nr:MAG: cyclic nucleotide-binding domain-containing protein [Jatrophihabitans sp.]
MVHDDTSAIVDQLAGSASFSRCDRSDIQALVAAGKQTPFPAHWAFVQEGTPADACYVLLSGTVKVFYGRQEVAVLGIGDIIGEGALVEGGQRTATVTSVEHGSALRVEYDALRALLADRPHLRETMVAVWRSRRPHPAG